VLVLVIGSLYLAYPSRGVMLGASQDGLKDVEMGNNDNYRHYGFDKCMWKVQCEDCCKNADKECAWGCYRYLTQCNCQTAYCPCEVKHYEDMKKCLKGCSDDKGICDNSCKIDPFTLCKEKSWKAAKRNYPSDIPDSCLACCEFAFFRCLELNPFDSGVCFDKADDCIVDCEGEVDDEKKIEQEVPYEM